MFRSLWVFFDFYVLSCCVLALYTRDEHSLLQDGGFCSLCRTRGVVVNGSQVPFGCPLTEQKPQWWTFS